ncbi:MAG: hypothetical protein QMC81_11560 [Thermoanaerobacterales bacterium]|nr:hypothetical protein [Thermoanaerobacterales bacterium]
MRRVLWIVVCLAVVLALAGPAFAETGQDAGQPPGGQAAPAGSGETIGGIPVVSPGELGNKLNQLGDIAYKQMSPITDMVAKLSIAASGFLLIMVLVLGAGIVRRVVAALFFVALGLGLWYNAPYVVGAVKAVAAWLQS